jgi:cytochrome c oxidase subunit 1
MFLFFNLTFFPLFFVGILGQPRRVFTYAANLQTWNDVSSIGAYLLGASFFLFIINFVWSIFIDPKRAPQNPWSSLGLEWKAPTPVPWYNFVRIPVVLSDPYHYGERDVVSVADLGVPEPAMAGAPGSPPGGTHG